MKKISFYFYLFITIVILNSCQQNEIKNIAIFYTNDEHGWMEANNDFGGAAGLVNLWNNEKFKSDSVLIISGGDMWTGPAISTWYGGESMVEVMNNMGYSVAAIGNHEFDVKEKGLRQRAEELNFPLIAANFIEKDSRQIPSYAKPYIIKEINGVKVGIIGLASISTPHTTSPINVLQYEFTDYVEAINRYAPIVKREADFVIIIAHICEDEMIELAKTAKKHGIKLIGGGHCHERVLKTVDDVLLMESGSGMRNYVKVELEFNKTSKSLKIKNKEIIENKKAELDSTTLKIIEKWKSKITGALSEEIGYCSKRIEKRSTEMQNMVIDSWLFNFSDADVAINNSTSIRQDIDSGIVKLETIVGLLPFDNMIYKLDILGKDLIEISTKFMIGGMTTIGSYTLSNGKPIYADSTYTILTTDYLYSVESTNLSKYDSIPENTYINYRQTTIDWIKSLKTTKENPLNNYLDNKVRN
ncbi:MAG: bifunctional metallophosphatase/5'-nucleotidase [Bacteroidales bacterium]|nr:bifunctional metallophosphatase/5'-nucleotidase [Bacteroidales bacterium]MBN2758199.1 bifunctional metallophosphatase/5'-nucleotidase [Bacteroidales bacterium]